MKFYQKWTGAKITDGVIGHFFPVTVPGNIQLDYANAKGWGDVSYMDNCTKFKELEDLYWIYRTELSFEKKSDERVFFVTLGIEYEYDVILNGEKLLHHVGMFTKVEHDITDALLEKNVLEVLIYPHPKLEGATECRDQAAQCVKPAVEYGWDWHPRLLVSGLWDECYIETRDIYSITEVNTAYTLNDDLTKANVKFNIVCNTETDIELISPDGKCVYKGKNPEFTVDNILLWWCNGQGEPNLYNWKVSNEKYSVEGHIGFKQVKLVMTKDHWKTEGDLPKPRAVPPITIELNGRNIFAKGTNWVNPEIFNGTIDEERYKELLLLAKDANMNILRCWGGAIINKEAFFNICDEFGLMVWQEFPLACNNYIGTDEYLNILEQEAISIIKRVSQHVSLVLWCGGNELFNSWSGMTDQSYALRLLNKLCYEYDRKTPFISTAPIMGMRHGDYRFYNLERDKSVFEIIGNSNATAYSEFGVPSITEMKFLKQIFDEETLKNPCEDSPWQLHHALLAGTETAWMCPDLIEKVLGKQENLEAYIEGSTVLQCEGYKFIFEEARRQRPMCAMALNWCFNEPWIVAAGNSLITYPNHPKQSYYAVKKSLSPVLPSAKFEHFQFNSGDLLRAELFLLNDSTKAVSDVIDAYVEIDGKAEHIGSWATGTVAENMNKRGVVLQYQLPIIEENQLIKVVLKGQTNENEYRLIVYGSKKPKRQSLNFSEIV